MITKIFDWGFDEYGEKVKSNISSLVLTVLSLHKLVS